MLSERKQISLSVECWKEVQGKAHTKTTRSKLVKIRPLNIEVVGATKYAFNVHIPCNIENRMECNSNNNTKKSKIAMDAKVI